MFQGSSFSMSSWMIIVSRRLERCLYLAIDSSFSRLESVRLVSQVAKNGFSAFCMVCGLASLQACRKEAIWDGFISFALWVVDGQTVVCNKSVSLAHHSSTRSLDI